MGAPVSRQECRFPISRIEFEAFSAADLEEVRNNLFHFCFLRDCGCLYARDQLHWSNAEVAVDAGSVLDQRERFASNSERERLCCGSGRISNLAEYSDGRHTVCLSGDDAGQHRWIRRYERHY